ncbi:natural killer cell receptor 2B4 isoform X5 [Struthio camelus]|uniref:natural killer cell receptor 2B4 isoform X5 n=1 Tax=Struthio camelus TaxID=8801 RepID=UPI0036042302
MELPGARCHQPALPQQVLLCFMLLAAAGEGCKDIVAAVGGELWLVPEEPSLLWESITWRVRLDKGERLRILTAKSSSVERPPVSRFSQRAIFHRGTLSLQISLVTEADSGVYAAHFENASSFEITSCFCVSVLGLLPTELWWALAAALGLVLAISAALITWRCRRRRGPAGNAEQPLTIYEEVGNAQRSRDHNGSSEAARVGNTIYTTICSKTPGPSCPREPESHTIYSVVQPSKRSPSVKRKRLEPALTSTAYTELAETSRRWRSLPQTSPSAPVGHHLS